MASTGALRFGQCPVAFRIIIRLPGILQSTNVDSMPCKTAALIPASQCRRGSFRAETIAGLGSAGESKSLD